MKTKQNKREIKFKKCLVCTKYTDIETLKDVNLYLNDNINLDLCDKHKWELLNTKLMEMLRKMFD